MPCISLPTAMLISGGLAAAGGIGSAIIGGNAAKQAAGVQAGAATKASDAQMAMFGKISDNLKPFMNTGVTAVNALSNLTGAGPGGDPMTAPLTKPFQPTMEQLAATPGYQFALQQGLRATQNAFSAKGLGESGAAMRGGIDYATGLASTTYQQQFGNYLAQNQQIYNMLGGLSSMGQNAAAQTGNFGMGAQTQANQFLVGGANAGAAGIIGQANAWGNGLNSAFGGIGNAVGVIGMNNAGMFGNPSAARPAAGSGVNATGYNMLFGGYPG